MSSLDNFLGKLKKQAKTAGNNMRVFGRKNWIGFVLITLATAIYFGPLITRVATYSDGGDVMFNAWTLARDQNCILHQNCPNYSDGNIYFPNKDSMLFSETQLSAGLLTLPLRVVTDNPILYNNVWTIVSFFFSGIFMYLLAKRLSKGNELFSLGSALIFEFAPIKIVAISHLQSQSIFYLPLIILLLLEFIDNKQIKKRYLIASFIAMVFLFYASWYQMVFGLIVIFPLLLGLFFIKSFDRRKILLLMATTILAVATTFPLAKEYIRFSKINKATFSINDQSMYSASLKDYVLPFNDTLGGRLYYQHAPTAKINGYNPDSSSYHGLTLYIMIIAITVLCLTAYGRKRVGRQEVKLLYIFLVIALVGFIVSLGPLLKLGASSLHNIPGSQTKFGIALPYILIDKFLPQLSFIRAIGRASIIVLFALCSILAIGAPLFQYRRKHVRYIFISMLYFLIFFELMPIHQFSINSAAYTEHRGVPSVYRYIHNSSQVDNIIILRSNSDYPGAPFPVARSEDVLWAGYHNKNIFNGYSGYEPPNYKQTYADFTDFESNDVAKLKKLNISYILVDKQLSSNSPLLQQISHNTTRKLYDDKRYSLFRL